MQTTPPTQESLSSLEVKIGPEIKETAEILQVIHQEFSNIAGVNKYVEDLATAYNISKDRVTYGKVYLAFDRLTHHQMIPPEFSYLAAQVMGHARNELNKSPQTEEDDERMAEQKVNEANYQISVQLLHQGYMPEQISKLPVNEKTALYRNIGKADALPIEKSTNYANEQSLLNPEVTDAELFEKYVTVMNQITAIIGSKEKIEELSATERVELFDSVIDMLQESDIFSGDALLKDIKICEEAAMTKAKKLDGIDYGDAEKTARQMFRKTLPTNVLSDEQINTMSLKELRKHLIQYNAGQNAHAQ